MRILLVNPPSGALTMGLKHLAKVEPLGLEILGAAVRDHEVRLWPWSSTRASTERCGASNLTSWA